MIDVDRGGKITFHGPGQLVGYPIVRLPDHVKVVDYVRRLEEALIHTCRDLGVTTARVPGRIAARAAIVFTLIMLSCSLLSEIPVDREVQHACRAASACATRVPPADGRGWSMLATLSNGNVALMVDYNQSLSVPEAVRRIEVVDLQPEMMSRIAVSL